METQPAFTVEGPRVVRGSTYPISRAPHPPVRHFTLELQLKVVERVRAQQLAFWSGQITRIQRSDDKRLLGVHGLWLRDSCIPKVIFHASQIFFGIDADRIFAGLDHSYRNSALQEPQLLQLLDLFQG